MKMIRVTFFGMRLNAKPLMMMVSGDDYENQTGIMMMIMTMKARLK